MEYVLAARIGRTQNQKIKNDDNLFKFLRFWDGSVCVLKRAYGERCSTTEQCIENLFLSCENGKCRLK